MSVLTLGLNHTTATVDLRGRFAFAVDQLAPALQGLHHNLHQRLRLQGPHNAAAEVARRYAAARG